MGTEAGMETLKNIKDNAGILEHVLKSLKKSFVSNCEKVGLKAHDAEAVANQITSELKETLLGVKLDPLMRQPQALDDMLQQLAAPLVQSHITAGNMTPLALEPFLEDVMRDFRENLY